MDVHPQEELRLSKAGKVRRRQAVVVVHGMGEQLPMETLVHFVDTALPADRRHYYSRPESVTGSYESRRFLVPRVTDVRRPGPTDAPVLPIEHSRAEELVPQTELFEYHWADKMQGNRLDDLLPLLRRMLLRSPSRVPHGLKVVWGIAWLLVLALVWTLIWGPWSDVWAGDGDVVGRILTGVASGGVAAIVLGFVLTKLLPKWLTGSFVDVVRYLDASPRSYAVRRDIRRGLVEMLTELHEAGTYDRIILIAHSLGGFIAYDAIAYLWGRMNHIHAGAATPTTLGGLRELEEAASALPDRPTAGGAFEPPDPEALEAFRQAQRLLFEGLRAQGNPWRISDLVTVGTPMYFADQLLSNRRRNAFHEKVDRRELPICPPHNEEADYNRIHPEAKRFYSWNSKDAFGVKRRVLYEGAPFSVVRWTNIYFPARLHFFGDWFGGPLQRLFGAGIKDVAVTGNRPGDEGANLVKSRFSPGWAHALYFDFADDSGDTGVARAIRDGLDLEATGWLRGATKPVAAATTGDPAGGPG